MFQLIFAIQYLLAVYQSFRIPVPSDFAGIALGEQHILLIKAVFLLVIPGTEPPYQIKDLNLVTPFCFSSTIAAFGDGKRTFPLYTTGFLLL